MDEVTFDDLVRSVYLDLCPSAFLDVAFDQWWLFTIECEHGQWRRVSNGIGDPTQALAKLIETVKSEHE